MWNFDAHQRAGPNPHFLPPTEDASQTVPSVLCTVLWTVLLTVLEPSGFDFLTSGTTHAQSFSMDKLSSCILILNSKVFPINSVCFFHILFSLEIERIKQTWSIRTLPTKCPNCCVRSSILFQSLRRPQNQPKKHFHFWWSKNVVQTLFLLSLTYNRHNVAVLLVALLAEYSAVVKLKLPSHSHCASWNVK